MEKKQSNNQQDKKKKRKILLATLIPLSVAAVAGATVGIVLGAKSCSNAVIDRKTVIDVKSQDDVEISKKEAKNGDLLITIKAKDSTKKVESIEDVLIGNYVLSD